MSKRLLEFALRWRIAFAFGVLMPVIASAQGFSACGPLENGYGPFDYRTQKDKIAIVERYHFDAGVETLARGVSGSVGSDLDYTLRASPNHHRALMALSRLAIRDKTTKPNNMRYRVDCWFERAERFAPGDAMVKVLFGLHLAKTGRGKEALAHLDAAREIAPKDGNLHYNMGLAYAELGQHEKALESAHIAYGLGYPLPGLKNRLVRAGKWRDPSPQ